MVSGRRYFKLAPNAFTKPQWKLISAGTADRFKRHIHRLRLHSWIHFKQPVGAVLSVARQTTLRSLYSPLLRPAASCCGCIHSSIACAERCWLIDVLAGTCSTGRAPRKSKAGSKTRCSWWPCPTRAWTPSSTAPTRWTSAKSLYAASAARAAGRLRATAFS